MFLALVGWVIALVLYRHVGAAAEGLRSVVPHFKIWQQKSCARDLFLHTPPLQITPRPWLLVSPRSLRRLPRQLRAWTKLPMAAPTYALAISPITRLKQKNWGFDAAEECAEPRRRALRAARMPTEPVPRALRPLRHLPSSLITPRDVALAYVAPSGRLQRERPRVDSLSG